MGLSVFRESKSDVWLSSWAMIPYLFLVLALWPLVCCGDGCPRTPVCIICSVAVALGAFILAQIIRELWLLRMLRGY